jgi:hypothetical protein
MNYTGAILIQGPSNHVDELKQAWKGYDLIWSTWKGDEKKYNSDDIVVFNEMPINHGKGNVALQQKTVLNGILKAKELDYNRVLKWRSDMIPTNSSKFIGLFDMNHINLFYFHVAGGGYFVDYFMEGNSDDIYNMWDFEDINPPFAERALTDNIRKRELNKKILFIGKIMSDKNDVIWLKKNKNLSTYTYQGSGFITTEIYYDK